VAILPGILIFTVIAMVTVLVIEVLKKDISGIKLMLLGISIILFGGVLVIDSSTNINGIDYIVMFVGLVFSIAGVGKKN